MQTDSIDLQTASTVNPETELPAILESTLRAIMILGFDESLVRKLCAVAYTTGRYDGCVAMAKIGARA
jgi:hypothetical protein